MKSRVKTLLLLSWAKIIRQLIGLCRFVQNTAQRIEIFLRAHLYIPSEQQVELAASRKRVRLQFGGQVAASVFLDGMANYESPSAQVWMKLCRQAELILDIGAHHGIYALLAADTNPNCPIFAFEPLPSNYTILEQNITAAGFAGIITPLPFALSNNTGLAALAVRGSTGSTLANDFWEDSASLPRVEVFARTLDDFLREQGISAGRTTLIKIDVETFEPEVFQGASELLQCRPAILCEVLATFSEDRLSEIFPPEAWLYYWISPQGPQQRRRIIGDPSWRYSNYLFLPKDSPFLNRWNQSP